MISVQEGRGRQLKATTSLNFAALLLLKPQKTSLSSRQKQHDETDRPSAAVVYRMNCIQCDFVILWPNRKITEDAGFPAQKKTVLMFYHNSKLACHVHECHQHMDIENVTVVGHEAHYHQRLFLEAWMSAKD